ARPGAPPGTPTAGRMRDGWPRRTWPRSRRAAGSTGARAPAPCASRRSAAAEGSRPPAEAGQLRPGAPAARGRPVPARDRTWTWRSVRDGCAGQGFQLVALGRVAVADQAGPRAFAVQVRGESVGEPVVRPGDDLEAVHGFDVELQVARDHDLASRGPHLACGRHEQRDGPALHAIGDEG